MAPSISSRRERRSGESSTRKTLNDLAARCSIRPIVPDESAAVCRSATTWGVGIFLNSDQLIVQSVAHELGGAAQAELLQDARLMSPDRLHRKVQLFADLGRPEA